MSRILLMLLLAFGVVLSVVPLSTDTKLTEVTAPVQVTSPTAPASELVGRVLTLDVGDLRKLSFRELYFLKHAVIASAGYEFSDDQPWLKDYFHRKVADTSLPPCKEGDAEGACTLVPSCEKACETLNLGAYEFPKVSNNRDFTLSPEMITALARIRQARFTKLMAMKDPQELTDVLDREKGAFPALALQGGRYVSVLGRTYPDERVDEALQREFMGNLSALAMIEQVKDGTFEFDEAELLAVEPGQIDLIQKAILARAGKKFAEPLKSELELLGVSSPSAGEAELSPAAKETVGRLDEIMERFTRGEMSRVPESLRAKADSPNDLALTYGGI